jgi:hypothetical protein
MNKNSIVLRLKELGFKDEDLEGIVADVTEVILRKCMNNYLLTLPEDTRNDVKELSEGEIIEYIQTNKDTLPSFSANDFEKIKNETWEEYFKSISET